MPGMLTTLLTTALGFRLKQVAPYNTFYSKLEAYLAQVGVYTTFNRWDSILTLGMVDPHDAFDHPAGSAGVLAEGATQLHRQNYGLLLLN
jgi:TBCC domain-containing protein 1